MLVNLHLFDVTCVTSELGDVASINCRNVIRDTLQPKEVSPCPPPPNSPKLHELIGGLRRCVTSLRSRYGDSPAMRRIVNDAERILNDIDRLDIDAEELELDARRKPSPSRRREDRASRTPSTTSDFWQDVDDEGLGGTR